MCIQVAMVLFVASVTSSNVPTTVKTVQQGETVNEPVLSVSALGEHDQLMVYHGSDSTELSGQYFCNNGICENSQASVCQFQVRSGDVCLIIPNVNLSNSGEYNIVLNGHTGIRTLNLTVLEAVPQHSHLTFPLVPVIVGSAAAVLFLVIVIFLIIRFYYKKLCFQRQGRLRYNFLSLSMKEKETPDHSHQGPQLQDAQGNV